MNQTKQIESRRSFLKRASLAALAIPLIAGCKDINAEGNTAAADELSLIKKNARRHGEEGYGAIDAPDDVSWKTALSKKSARDVPLIISGTIFQPDGRTPAPNVLIYFYHTDSEGIYGRGGGEPKHGHFRGWLLTDSKGRYEFSSIKPASYPNSTISSHVHMTITGVNFQEDWIDSILFEGDRFITAQERNRAGGKGGFNPILKLEKDSNSIWRGRRDIKLWQS